MAVLEALTAARPILATSVGGVPSIVRDRETGILVDAGDGVALAEAIERLLDDRVLADELGRHERELVGSEYGLETMARSVEAVYDQTLRG